MNLLEAKSVLLQESPRVPVNLIAIEIALLTGAAGIMVLLFT